jgi:hypothetical protein
LSRSIICRRTWRTPDNRLSRFMQHHVLRDRDKVKTLAGAALRFPVREPADGSPRRRTGEILYVCQRLG